MAMKEVEYAYIENDVGFCYENEMGEYIDFSYENKDSVCIEVELDNDRRHFIIPLNAIKDFIKNGE